MNTAAMFRAWGDPGTWSKEQRARFLKRSKREDDIVKEIQQAIERHRELGSLDDVDEGRDGAMLIAYHYGFACGVRGEEAPTASSLAETYEEFRTFCERVKSRMLAIIARRESR